jgi:hypothetical protein
MNVRREARGALLSSDANTLCELVDLVRRGQEMEAVSNFRLEGMTNSTRVDLDLGAKSRSYASNQSEPLSERRVPFSNTDKWGKRKSVLEHSFAQAVLRPLCVR